MRKLILSTAAAVAATTGAANLAHAQAPAPATTYTVVPKLAIPSPPAPGTIAVSLGGLFQYFVGGTNYSGQNYKGQKTANYLTQGFTRIYLGMDGQSSNGILYGTQFQIRQNFGTASASATTVTPSPGQTGSTLYVRTGYGYIGTPTLGKLMFGAGGGPMTAFATGMFEGFNDGAWNGDVPAFVSGNTLPLYPYQDNAVLYSTDKISYFSPAFGTPATGLVDFGVSWEPSFVTLNNSTSCTSGASASGVSTNGLSSCDNLSSSNQPGDAQKRRNTFDLGARYRATFGPVGVKVNAGWIGSGVVSETGLATTGASVQKFKGLNVPHIGTEITYAGVTVGGHFSTGDENGQWGLRPDGGVRANFYMAGAQYQAGPLIVGASYFNNQNQGDFQNMAVEGQRVEWGIAAGGTYALTPGLGIYLAYLYGDRKQSNYDFLSGQVASTNNDVKSQALGLGVTMQW